jgi:predicted permease
MFAAGRLRPASVQGLQRRCKQTRLQVAAIYRVGGPDVFGWLRAGTASRGRERLDKLRNDVRYGLRMLGKNPGFTLVIVVTLALGIGANTAIFSIVNSLLLRSLPVRDASRLTLLAYRLQHGPVSTNFSIAEYRDLRDQTSRVLSNVIGYQFGLDGLSVNGRADRIVTNFVTSNYFSALGIKPALGRLILPTEGDKRGADPVIVLSYKYWKSHLGGDTGVIGRKAFVNGQPVTIIGVTPEDFYGLYVAVDTQGYLPLGMISIEPYPSDVMTNRENRNLFVLGWLRPGVTVAGAQSALNVIANQFARQYPQADKGLSLEIYPERRARPNPDPKNTVAIIAGLFLALAGVVLLLACVNVANILLVRATVREREMAIRAALGAEKGALVRQ